MRNAEWSAGDGPVAVSGKQKCRMKNEEATLELGPLPLSSFFILHSTFDISVLVSGSLTAYLDVVCANPVITYEPDLASFLILIRFAFCASSSRSLNVS